MTRALRNLLLAGSLLAGPALAAPAPGAAPAADPLAETGWNLTSLAGQPATDGPTLTLGFDLGGMVAGSDGCNRYRGSYEIEGGGLAFSRLLSTQMACPQPVMERADAFRAALAQTSRFAREGGRLTLLDAGGQELARFEAASRSLAGSAWQVTGYNNGREAVVSTLTGTELTAEFGEDGRVTGSAGCNRYIATYDASDGSITLGQPGASRRACAEPEGVMEQESEFLAALASAATFRMEGDRLELRTADGALAVTLTRAKAAPDPAPAQPDPSSGIRFDLDRLDADGLQGPPDGLRALHYELCVPDRPEAVRAAREIDPTLEVQPGSPGRIGCGEGQALALGHTHQPGYRAVLERLAALPGVDEIREAVFE